eukprot:GHVU01190963.1.p3 GENE.GHVU01190963.1~~GHVU01190963.1.p3  ORF type:complete len:117 (-),score=16.52 GHVU01190963.1:224-574(-)
MENEEQQTVIIRANGKKEKYFDKRSRNEEFGMLTTALTEVADDDKGRFHSAADASGINGGVGSGVLSIGKSESGTRAGSGARGVRLPARPRGGLAHAADDTGGWAVLDLPRMPTEK